MDWKVCVCSYSSAKTASRLSSVFQITPIVLSRSTIYRIPRGGIASKMVDASRKNYTESILEDVEVLNLPESPDKEEDEDLQTEPRATRVERQLLVRSNQVLTLQNLAVATGSHAIGAQSDQLEEITKLITTNLNTMVRKILFFIKYSITIPVNQSMIYIYILILAVHELYFV